MRDKHLTDEEIILYIDNELTIDDRIGVDEHLKKCSVCKTKLKEYKEMEKYLREPVLYAPPVNLLNSIMEKVWEKKLSFEEVFIGLMVTFSGIVAILGFIIYRYGFEFFYNIPFMKVSLPTLIKTGINNLYELFYVLKKIYFMIDIGFLRKIIIPKHGLAVLLLFILIIISYIKRDIIIKGRK
jgi:predicted anti-sigma-YlaC factor YlaD